MLSGLRKRSPQVNDQKQAGWFVYILCCCDQTYYTGITNDVDRRLQQHNLGKAARYTRSRRPVELVYLESACTRSEALIREAQIKHCSRQAKSELAHDWLKMVDNQAD